VTDTPGFIVYTDGSCFTGDRVGSYAYVVIDEDDLEYTGGLWEYDTTISRMELMGPIAALETIRLMRGPSIVLVYSDSQYVVLGITHRKRQRNKNVDLWDRLDAAVDAHELVEFAHVKGHNGDHYNEMCDEMATKLRKEGQQNAH
jgi:ribonuclease HI